MRVVFWTRPAFLDTSLPLVQALASRLEVHLVIEVAPESWCSGLLDLPPQRLHAGLQPAAPVLGPRLPTSLRGSLGAVASAQLLVQPHRRSLDPRGWVLSAAALRSLRRFGARALHVVEPSVRLAPALVLSRDALVIDVHDPLPHRGEESWRAELARRITFPLARRFVLHNRALEAAFCRRYGLSPRSVKAVPLGVTPALVPSGGEHLPTESALLFFGRLSDYKGLDVLYAALPRVAERVPGLHVVVAGRAVRGYVPPPAPELPNGGRVEVLDRYVTNAETARCFGSAALVVCPYRDATQSGVALLAYAHGVPVVASDVGGLREYVHHGETGLLVPPQDPTALAEALTALLNDRDLRSRLGRGAAAVATGALSWERIAEQTLDVYRGLTGAAD